MSHISPMPGSASLAPDLRRRGASPASDSNGRGVHADTVSPGYRKLSYLPPERRIPVRFGLESPLGVSLPLVSYTPTAVSPSSSRQAIRSHATAPHCSASLPRLPVVPPLASVKVPP